MSNTPKTSPEAETVPADSGGTVLTINDLMRLLPHRYPMLLVDRLINVVPSESAVGVKNVTMNEPYFQGHFPGHPVMPGVFMVEAMAQTAAALVAHSMEEGLQDRVVYFMTIDKARFRQPVHPGDTLMIPVRKVRSRGPVWKFHGEARVGDALAAEAEYSAMIVDS
ncbi:MAG: 3-hydroxyacyl-ACP dehydratase FabZ [Alphaproteobacteria bacterium]